MKFMLVTFFNINFFLRIGYYTLYTNRLQFLNFIVDGEEDSLNEEDLNAPKRLKGKNKVVTFVP